MERKQGTILGEMRHHDGREWDGPQAPLNLPPPSTKSTPYSKPKQLANKPSVAPQDALSAILRKFGALETLRILKP